MKCNEELSSHTYLNQFPLDRVVNKVYSLSLLPVIQALLGYMKWVGCLSQSLLQNSLGFTQIIDLLNHQVRFMVYLILRVIELKF